MAPMPSATALGLGAFALVLGTGTLWFRRALRVRLPENRSRFVAAMAISAALGVFALAGSPGWIGGVPAALAVLLGGFFLITVSISAQKGGAGAFQLGAPVPAIAAPDENGEPFQLSSLTGGPLLLKFFRGHW